MKIKNPKDLQIARLEAKLRAEQSLATIKKSSSSVKGNVTDAIALSASLKGLLGSLGGSFTSWFDSSRDSSSSDNSNVTSAFGLGTAIAGDIAKNGAKWKPLLLTILIWLIKSGYLNDLSRLKKSDVYWIALQKVRQLRKSLK